MFGSENFPGDSSYEKSQAIQKLQEAIAKIMPLFVALTFDPASITPVVLVKNLNTLIDELQEARKLAQEDIRKSEDNAGQG